jgi:hypothetical protein
MKTAKIKSIHQIKPWNGPNGTVYYHWLEMDNGDLIDIGKKKELKVGWDITYEITETQHKYNKAKTVKPEGGFPKKSDDSLLGIKIGHALNCASVLIAGKEYKTGSEFESALNQIRVKQPKFYKRNHHQSA